MKESSDEETEFLRGFKFDDYNDVLSSPIPVKVYCPEDKVSSSIRITISLNWKGVESKKNKYELPMYCMPCDSEDCSITSKTYFETVEDWIAGKNPTPPVTDPDPEDPDPEDPDPEDPDPENPDNPDNPEDPENPTASPPEPPPVDGGISLDPKPVDKSAPELQLPPGFTGTYLDFPFNAMVPVLLPNGQVVEVKICAPSVESISSTGRVSIVFSKPIEAVDKSLYGKIADAGVITASL